MVLHARVVMDLREKFEQEIRFEQVEGDFYSFKGKWRLEQLGDQHTLLKYMVETKMHRDTFLSESILEEVSHICIFFNSYNISLVSLRWLK
jgi:ribosome-associated toxin RatA of RatAB toxin-antitoxin module